ncbi:hypothetical protein IV37_GL000100 [Fructilactobacillus fructivorans]|uniref:Bax inhibitor-1/YccA family protein n=1 Tax=Fructilactobacillus fructivorans TaxID=1614 RepID=UPI000704A473|nr:Bax inhibitor-1/YccA family protein [Fructilactobacillus fructivorans]KRN13384.1 hypothetical protein IV37_GL000100 [Fructilactobacillus fructivorans]
MNNFDGESGRRMVGDNAGLNAFFTKVYGIMGIAVLISAISAYLSSVFMPNISSGASGLVILVVWFIISFVISGFAQSNPTLSFIGLLVFSVLTGFSLSYIFIAFNLGTIGAALVSSASIFLVMSAIGFTTHKDLTKLSTQLFAALIALIIAMVINLFLRNPWIELFISAIGIIIFTALSATDTQNLKKMYNQYAGEINVNGLAISGALQLCLDFLNLFTFLLEIFGIFGNNRD